MSTPCIRTSPARKRKRRSHLAMKAVNVSLCPNCGSARLPHRACRSCGYVRPGLQVQSTEGI